MTELRCEHCQRFIGEVEAIVGEIMCPNPSCKAGNQFKILVADESKLLTHKFAKPPRPPKKKAVAPEAGQSSIQL